MSTNLKSLDKSAEKKLAGTATKDEKAKVLASIIRTTKTVENALELLKAQAERPSAGKISQKTIGVLKKRIIKDWIEACSKSINNRHLYRDNKEVTIDAQTEELLNIYARLSPSEIDKIAGDAVKRKLGGLTL